MRVDSLDCTQKFVDSRIRFCVECGSTKVEVYGKYLVCSDCKVIRNFKAKQVRFQPGDFVRITERGKSPHTVYEIVKIKKSKEGTVSYMLKSKSSRTEIPYYEGDASHLEKIVTARVKSKKSSKPAK